MDSSQNTSWEDIFEPLSCFSIIFIHNCSYEIIGIGQRSLPTWIFISISLCSFYILDVLCVWSLIFYFGIGSACHLVTLLLLGSEFPEGGNLPQGSIMFLSNLIHLRIWPHHPSSSLKSFLSRWPCVFTCLIYSICQAWDNWLVLV